MAYLKQTIYTYSRSFRNKGVRKGALLRLETSDGKIGWGEVAPLPGFSKESLDDALNDLIEGKESSYPSVQWGKASALLDLTAPLEIDSIPIRVLEKEKVKVGHLSLKQAIEKVEKTNCSSVDMNQKWTLDDALKFAKHFPNIESFEEPLMPNEDASKFSYPVSLDESLRQGALPPYPFVKSYVIKPTLQGYPFIKKVKGVDFILSSSYESELGIYQIAKLAYRLKLPLIPMGLGTCHLFEEPLFEKEPYYKNGHLHFPTKWRLKMDKVKVIFDGCI